MKKDYDTPVDYDGDDFLYLDGANYSLLCNIIDKNGINTDHVVENHSVFWKDEILSDAERPNFSEAKSTLYVSFLNC